MPGSKLLRIVFLVLALASWIRVGMTQEQAGADTSAPPHQGGWVIELGEDGKAQTDTEVTAKPETGSQTVPAPSHNQSGTGVEMIVGGQGSGGVAKKGTLPVID